MKKIFDKLGAIWCILTRKEYIVFSCDDFANPNTGKCWVSYGIQDHTNKDRHVFLEASKDYIELIISNDKQVKMV